MPNIINKQNTRPPQLTLFATWLLGLPLVLGVALLSSTSAQAGGACWLSGPALNFGAVSGAGKSSSTNWQVTCNHYKHTEAVNVTLCPFATVGGLGLANNRRQMVSYAAWPHSFLTYDLFYDPALTQRIDTQASASTLKCISQSIAVGENQKVFNLPIYGFVYAGQTVAAGSYQNNNDISVTLLYGLSQNKPLSMEDVLSTQTGNQATNALRVTTNYENSCNLIAATDLNFGQINDLSKDISSSSVVTLACPLNTSWKISLDRGVNANGTTRRMRKGSDYIAYELYKDAQNSRAWSNSVTEQGSGSNSSQSIYIYGKVGKSAIVPAPGDYQDTITVTLTY